MSKQYSVFTAIYYVNSTPHIGSALEAVAADVTTRYHRLKGEDVFFCTGTDEQALKVMEAAQKAGKAPQAFVDEIAGQWKDIFKKLHIAEDYFIRTTDEVHVRAVQEFFSQLQAKGYIYKGNYEGWYDVSTETFYKESDLVNGKSPDGNEVRWVSEENYYFKLSAFEDRLLKHIEAHPEFIMPTSRRNEVVSFIKQGLRDASISRSNPGWGIPVPGDESKVIYVWFDALINYVAASGWPDSDWESRWPADVQWLGKDILTRFHATLWPAMLMGIDLPLPKTLCAHEWLLIGKEKISKSRGNVIAPLELAADLVARTGATKAMAIDAVRSYMMGVLPINGDSTFTYSDFDRVYNSNLANDLGNALNRSLAMAHKFFDGGVPEGDIEPDVKQAVTKARNGFDKAMETFRIDEAQDSAFELVRFLNKYIDQRAPWQLAKTGDAALGNVLRSMLFAIRSAEGLVRPIMPRAADAIADQLGLVPLDDWSKIGSEASLPVGTALKQPEPIFPRIHTEHKEKDMETEVKKPEPPKPAAEAPAPIGIEDFMKVQLKVGRVVEAENLEGSDKLLKLQVQIGEERRQIVAGIRAGYAPIDLIGRQVVVVANLKPAKLRGVESQGMLLAAVDEDGKAILLQPDRESPEGAQVR
ncbi:MAG: methionine--tRNA ligase [Armatimonadetes bacterium]|nr:methionine--tRNA ligase [Armatimonadota bacterium]